MRLSHFPLLALLLAGSFVAATLEGTVSESSLNTAARTLVAHLPKSKRFTETARAFCNERLSRGERQFGNVRCLECGTFYPTDVLFLIHNCGRPPQLMRRETV